MTPALLLISFALLFLPVSSTQKDGGRKTGNIQAGKGVNNAKPTPTPTPAPRTELVRVKFSSSRPEVAVNGGYGVFAELENVGSSPVALYADEVVLVVQPEVTRSTNCVYQMTALFPTEKPGTSPVLMPTPTTDAGSHDNKRITIVLQPDELYAVFWDISTVNTSGPGCQVADLFRTTSFVPGEYTFTVDGKAYLVSEKGEVEGKYHTFTDKTILRVSIPQTWSMFAAMFGGFIAYFVTVLRKGSDFGIMKPESLREKFLGFGRFVRDLVSAGLMGSVVTILASRLSETQFPIKVSVNDVWGAGAVGFIAYFVGYKVIDKLVGTMPATANRPALADAEENRKKAEELRRAEKLKEDQAVGRAAG